MAVSVAVRGYLVAGAGVGLGGSGSRGRTDTERGVARIRDTYLGTFEMGTPNLKLVKARPSGEARGSKRGPRPTPDLVGLRRSGVGDLPAASAVKDRLDDEEAVRKWNEVRRLCPWLSRDEISTVEQLSNAASAMQRGRLLWNKLMAAEKIDEAAKVRVMWMSAQQLVYKLGDSIGLVHPGRARYLKMLHELENTEIDEFAV